MLALLSPDSCSLSPLPAELTFSATVELKSDTVSLKVGTWQGSAPAQVVGGLQNTAPA